jgi:dihydrolipoamide dehydrogenase
MINDHYDVLVIGGGPGGTPAAMQIASRGKKVLLVEKSGKLGGACLFSGCIPSKIIKHGADEFASVSRAGSGEDRHVAWRNIRATMERILSLRSGGALQMVNHIPGLTFVAGAARFASNDRVEIEEISGEKRSCTFERAIISTGSVPSVPHFGGTLIRNVLTSEMLFEQEDLPESLVIIGGGPIGVELAQMLSHLNVKCTIIEMLDSILQGVVEPEFVERLTHKLVESGIDVHVSAKVTEIKQSDGGFSTSFTDAQGAGKTLRSRQVLVAVGRLANVEGLNLKATGIRYSERGIVVDEYLETHVNGIFATGDVIAGPKFAHTATYEAHVAAANILHGNVQKADVSKNSWVLFSDPEISSVGYTQADAVKRGHEIMTGTYNYEIDAAAQISGNTFGFLKFVVEKKTLRILGIHVFTRGAGSLIGEAALVISRKLTLQDVAQTIHPHPTKTEAFGMLAINMLGSLNQIGET